MNRTVTDLLDAIRAHLAEFELPELWAVEVTASTSGPGVSAQLVSDEAPVIAAALLAWADTLDEVTAEAWRVSDGRSVHLSVTGRLSGGTAVRVYGGVWFPACGLGAALSPGERTPVLLGALRSVASLAEVAA